MTSVLLCTDLSVAYDTVDHEILFKKLQHYGIRGKSNNIMRSYLHNRRQFVQLDTFKSEILNSPACSVVQGGKLSGLLYNLYTNEVPELYQLLDNNKYITINKNIIKDTNHTTVQFVDDSNNIIAFKNNNMIRPYLENLTIIRLLQ